MSIDDEIKAIEAAGAQQRAQLAKEWFDGEIGKLSEWADGERAKNDTLKALMNARFEGIITSEELKHAHKSGKSLEDVLAARSSEVQPDGKGSV